MTLVQIVLALLIAAVVFVIAQMFLPSPVPAFLAAAVFLVALVQGTRVP